MLQISEEKQKEKMRLIGRFSLSTRGAKIIEYGLIFILKHDIFFTLKEI